MNGCRSCGRQDAFLHSLEAQGCIRDIFMVISYHAELSRDAICGWMLLLIFRDYYIPESGGRVYKLLNVKPFFL